jgi:hypothetical protein
MYPLSSSSHQGASPVDTSIMESAGPAAMPVADRIRFAKQSTCFAHEADVTLTRLPQWLQASDARPELSCTLLWLKTLLPGQGEEAVVRNGVDNLAGLLLDPGRVKAEDLLALYGPIKRDLHVLCERLEAEPEPSTVAAACRELRSALGAAQGLGTVDAIARAIERAVSAVEDQAPSPQRRGEAQASRPVPQPRRTLLAGLTSTPAVPSLVASSAVPLPKSGDVALTQALKDMGTEGVRACYAQLGAAFDRLVTLMPPDTNPLLKTGVIAWRDSYAAPVEGFGRADAEMLFGGRLMLTALCNKLDELDLERRRDAFQGLKFLMPQEYVQTKARGRSNGSHVSMLANVLTDVESTSEVGNPHLEERRRSFEALVAPLLKRGQVTADDIDNGMFKLGLAPDWAVHGANSRMHPVYNNAAWKVCLESVLGPIEPHPLADVRKAERLLARR